MAIEEFYSRSEHEVVSFDLKNINFSVSLVEKYGLEDLDYARIGIDPELHRIYFSFQKDPAPGLSKFYRQTDRSKRRMIAVGQLYSKYDWIKAIKTEKERAKRQFVLEQVDPSQEDIYPKYKFFITIGYAWSENRDFHDPEQYPEEPGVYRLKKDGEVVRIGEAKNIARRLKEHHSTYGSEVDIFDFEIVPNDSERTKEEHRLLDHFKETIGRLPKLNTITN
jgi:hypothetical protein